MWQLTIMSPYYKNFALFLNLILGVILKVFFYAIVEGEQILHDTMREGF